MASYCIKGISDEDLKKGHRVAKKRGTDLMKMMRKFFRDLREPVK